MPFHAVSFPGTLLGSGEPWKTVDVIKGFHWLNYEGGKFSTSRNRGIFTDAALEELPADYWRWWLIANAPETADTDFTIRRFTEGVNKDLADVFGNLVQRTFALAARQPAEFSKGGELAHTEIALAREIAGRVGVLRSYHEGLEFRRAAAETREIWAQANTYLQNTAPWAKLKTDPHRAASCIGFALRLVHLSARLAWSIIPTLSEKVLASFGENGGVPAWPERVEDFLLTPLDVKDPDQIETPFVRKLSPADVSRLCERFGTQEVVKVSTGSSQVLGAG